MAKKNRRFNATFGNAPTVSTEFNPDYSNVKKDLSRIGILAAVFFGSLIVLSFFIK